MPQRLPTPLAGLSRWVAPEGRLRRRRLFAVLLATYAIFAVTYSVVNAHSIGRPAHALWLPGERAIPFIPEFEFLYALAYFVPLVAVFRLPDARAFARLLLAMGVTLTVAYATYIAFPVYLERPPLEVRSLATFLLWLEYHDPSYNHFPSLHVATAWLFYFACRPAMRRSHLFLALLVGIATSTLFVKQHYLVDVVYGVALAWLAWRLSGRLVRLGTSAQVRGTPPGTARGVGE
jgi:membrane-associated phospholipid phosphatase